MIRSFTLERQTAPVRWAGLLALSALLAGVLIMAEVPAALLLGPMLAGIAFASIGGELDIPEPAFGVAQGLLGCMIGSILARTIGGDGNWIILISGALSVVVFSSVLGWLLSRSTLLPGTTALWGLSPGAASTMTVLSEAYGANQQMVALMQYLRVVLVAIVASTGARLLGATVPTHAAVQWFSPIHPIPFATTLAIAIGGPLLSKRLGLRAGALLLPMAVSAVLIKTGLVTLDLPRWLLAGAYALIGWRIGLRFTVRLLMQAARALPQILLCTCTLIALCAGLSFLLVKFAGVDPITAWLATSPGGADTAAIIAAASQNVDAGFIMTMQTLRFLSVLVFGPFLTKFLSNRKGAA